MRKGMSTTLKNSMMMSWRKERAKGRRTMKTMKNVMSKTRMRWGRIWSRRKWCCLQRRRGKTGQGRRKGN